MLAASGVPWTSIRNGMYGDGDYRMLTRRNPLKIAEVIARHAAEMPLR